MVSARSPFLDCLRGFAILIVVLWHYVGVDVYKSGLGVHNGLARLFTFGWSGVTLFFVLSGYLIGKGVLENSRASNKWKVFFVRRACRILPLYLISLLTYIAAREWTNLQASAPRLFEPSLPLWTYFTFTQNFASVLWKTMGGHWLAVSWSLAVEEQFYLMLPCLVWWLRPGRRLLAAVVVAGVLLAPLLRMAYPGGYPLLPWHLDALLLGVGVALLISSPAAKARVRLGIVMSLAGSAAVLVLAVAARGAFMGDGALQFLMALLFASLLLLGLTQPEHWTVRWVAFGFLAWLGQVSFGAYLFHEPIATLVFRGQAPHCHSWQGAGWSAVSLAITLGVAHLAHVVLERPLMQWGRTFQYSANQG